MKLDAAQEKLVKSKPCSVSFIKGGESSGKTTAAIYRAHYLKNNYCLYDNDNILMIVKDEVEKKKVIELYDSIKQWSYMQYMTLFADNRSCLEILTEEEMINKFLDISKYNESKKSFILIDMNVKRNIVSECILTLKNRYKRSKLLKNSYTDFLIEELSWIKSCNYDNFESYQNADRIGRKALKGKGPSRLMKNSYGREVIYELFKMYNEKLKERNYIDEEDRIIYILNYLREATDKLKYTHVIVDGGERLTKAELEIMKNLCSNKTYSSLLLILNTGGDVSKNAWIQRNRKYSKLGFETVPKAFWLRNKFEINNAAKVSEGIGIKEDSENLMFIENYEYLDIRHRRKYDFTIDTSNIGEVIMNNNAEPEIYRDNEVKQIPMYSDIAAGEPIYINDELESNFYIPNFWLRGMSDCFILKVKGDSMIGADINDGDFVVIQKQYSAQNGDIVAADLDGSATLKRLSIKKDRVMLLPENEKYKPIAMNEDNSSILGIAIGIIKNKH